MSGESQRIYWQQWALATDQSAATTTATSTTTTQLHRSRRDLITSSAAVRMTPEAQAKDVATLLRESLRIETDEALSEDALVLVGTLYSLPPHYVVFEHERHEEQASREHQLQKQSQGVEASVKLQSYGYQHQHHRSDPFHVVRTLLPDENPLVVRDRMVERLRKLQQLAPCSRTIISPKLQFFYVNPATNIPSCIELDGYSTSMEEEIEEDESYEDDVDLEGYSDENENGSNGSIDYCEEGIIQAEVYRRFPWLSSSSPSSSSSSSSSSAISSNTIESTRIPPADIDQRRREYRYRQYLVQTTSQSASTCMSGYLLKRSHDPHVWRRVHCVLTDDRLWFVSRIYNNSNTRNNDGHAKHGSIRLARALLLLSDQNSSFPNRILRTIPFSFELVSAKGVSHIFRATSKRRYMTWMQSLQSRILQAGENSLVDHAELILADESIARSKRMTACAAAPLWEAIVVSRQGTTEKTPISIKGPLGTVLRWGLQVADFRETCKYLHSMLPPRSPVVAMNSTRSSSISIEEPLEPALVQMIQGVWDQATALLARATHIGRHMLLHQIPEHGHRNSLLSSIETHCRHVEYIITGRLRPLLVGAGVNGEEQEDESLKGSSEHVHNSSSDAQQPLQHQSNGVCGDTSSSAERSQLPHHHHRHHNEPPPTDLFDQLLHELQVHAAEAAVSQEANGGNLPLEQQGLTLI